MSNETSINQRITELEARMKQIEEHFALSATKQPSAVAIQSKSLSLREFLIGKKPTGDVQKTVAIGYFLEIHEKMSAFNVTDLLRGFERAKDKKPLNLNDKVNMAIRKGYFDEKAEKKDSRKAWVLTDTGINFVEHNFKN
ncbi:MAG: hypothetical protein V1649_04200 [Patescibacteria group bacterium]